MRHCFIIVGQLFLPQGVLLLFHVEQYFCLQISQISYSECSTWNINVSPDRMITGYIDSQGGNRDLL